MKNKSDNEVLLEYLKAGNVIEPKYAWQRFGIYRLASRVCDLRKMGYNIQTRIISNGHEHWAEYWMPTKVAQSGQLAFNL